MPKIPRSAIPAPSSSFRFRRFRRPRPRSVNVPLSVPEEVLSFIFQLLASGPGGILPPRPKLPSRTIDCRRPTANR